MNISSPTTTHSPSFLDEVRLGKRVLASIFVASFSFFLYLFSIELSFYGYQIIYQNYLLIAFSVACEYFSKLDNFNSINLCTFNKNKIFTVISESHFYIPSVIFIIKWEFIDEWLHQFTCSIVANVEYITTNHAIHQKTPSRCQNTVYRLIRFNSLASSSWF